MEIGAHKTRIVITIPIHIKERLDKQASKERHTVANLVTNLITDYLYQIEEI